MLERIREQSGFRIAQPARVWSVFDEAPEIAAALEREQPGISSALSAFSEQVLVQPRWGFGESGPFARPDRHVRAFYLKLEETFGFAGCLAFKGTEPCADNLALLVDRLASYWSVLRSTLGWSWATGSEDWTVISALERFPVLETKPPVAHPLEDALEEARAAALFQRMHLERRRALARVPVPLFVFRWEEETNARLFAAIEPKLSPRAARMVKAQLSAPLGAYVYWYPRVPLRAAHVSSEDAKSRGAWTDRRARLNEACDPTAAVQGWISLCARMLALGFVPADPTQIQRGYCLHPQNLVLDGGCVDLDSLRRAETFSLTGQLDMAIVRSVQTLATSICWFLAGPTFAEPAFQSMVPDAYARIRAAVAERLAEEPQVPEAIARAVIEADVVRGLDRLFESVLSLGAYRAADSESDEYQNLRE